jgi:uncharacterized protein (TIGR02246 family)
MEQAQISAEDEAAIRDLLGTMSDAWARGDGTAYAAVFDDDARYVNAPGTRSVGRQAIADSHQKIFDSVLKGTRLGGTYPAELQPVTPNVVLVHSSGAVLFPGESEQRVPPNGLITMVAARDAGSWRFVSFSNTPTGRARNARFVWRYLASRLSMFRTEARKARAHMLAEKQQNMYFAGRTTRLGNRGGYSAAKRGTKHHEEDHPR